MRSTRSGWFFALSVAVAGSLVGAAASAEPSADAESPPLDAALAAPAPRVNRGASLAVDTSAVWPVLPSSTPGFAVDLRAGYRFESRSCFVLPELAVGFLDLAPGLPADAAYARVGAGVRLGVRPGSDAIETSFFSHLGVAFNEGTVVPRTDLGIAADVRTGPRFTVGAHLAWDVWAASARGSVYIEPVWLLGGHAGFYL